ncbi:MAG: chromosome segregation protein SMC [Micrococcales bacterium]|nr:chromosome segregation protein SMC [Micrococcales bacterium]
MHLKSLTLKGFKSFASPTTFAFEPGVTAVVGPNGSGKSNVVDGLAWVMGEQGAKTLRGGKMEDVIFAGTATRGPLGRAEVTLTIDNADGALPIEYSEVTISRTLFRSGGSEYAINGSPCRLLDVQELLSDSGLGREMHVIVGQGRLDQILHATPEERRGFIEEAAGILKHRRRKEKTVRKLDAMQANLTRLSDLAGEVRRQLKPLGRQAEVAREAQSIQRQVRDARSRLLADEVVALRESIADIGRDESMRKTERLVIQEQLDQSRLRIGRLEQTMTGVEVDAARQVAFGLEQVQDRLRALSTLALQRLTLLRQQDELPVVTQTVTPSMVADAREDAQRLEGEIGHAEQALGRAAAATVAARASLDALDEEISAQSALVSQHDLEAARLQSRSDAAAQTRAALTVELERQRGAHAEAQARRDTARAQFEALDPEGGGADDDLGGDTERAEAELRDRQAALEQIRDRTHAAERERESLEARVVALTMAAGSHQGADAVTGRPGIRGLVADFVRVEPGWEPAIAAALGELGEAALAETRDAGLDALESAREAQAGRVDIVVSDAVPPPSLGALPAGVRTATSLVDAPAGIRGLLARAVVVDDLDVARAAWPQLAHHDGLAVITREGDVLTEYVLRGGTDSTRSRLERIAERDSAAERLAAAVTGAERARAELAEERGRLAGAQDGVAAARARQREIDAERAARSQQLARGRERLESAEAETRRLEERIGSLADSVRDAEGAASRALQEVQEHRERPRPILDASARDDLVAELDAARAVEVDHRIAVEAARQRVRAQLLAAESMQQQLEAERIAADETARIAALRARQVEASSAVLDSMPPVSELADRSVAEARVVLAAAEAARARQNEELAALRRGEGELRERLSILNEDVHGLEMQVYEKKLHLSSLLERAAAELGLDEEVLVAEYGPEVPVPNDAPGGTASDDLDATEPVTVPFVRAEQQKRLAEAERKLGLLGRVNPLALEEFAALEERHRFLTEQLADLTKTRRDLLTILQEIDERMQDIFRSAFDDTRAAFNRVFPVLFPGGSGSIFLTDPEELLTTGIEVTVKPAGKRIERLSLLSGGERSLAAVALLIAIFKARPSPFYIMDEVEAALDDANLGRLLTIFEDLRAASQLIIITHQKRTMEIADALYGVSMRQDGVSAVVGQRLQTDRAVAS